MKIFIYSGGVKNMTLDYVCVVGVKKKSSIRCIVCYSRQKKYTTPLYIVGFMYYSKNFIHRAPFSFEREKISRYYEKFT